MFILTPRFNEQMSPGAIIYHTNLGQEHQDERVGEMKPVVDPEGVEVSHFISACSPEGKKILEIGCGHGSLTYQYSNLAGMSVGIDPAYSELLLANDGKPNSAMNIVFIRAKAEALPFPAQFYDTVLFASSL
jgi:2-polyprenyl-3-methyl-5-hydroxy-6-metoxy-1,4-benzoquinol methylase